MLFYPFLCFSTFIIASSATLTPGAVPLPPPAVTLAPRAGPSIATITLAPLSEYEATATKTASPTGSDLTIVARSEPTDGVDVYLAPDLSKKVEDIIHDKCGAQKAPDCEKSVQDVMESQQMGLQARQAITLGLIGIWAAGIVAAAVIAMVSNNKPASHVHIPGGDIAQVSSASKASINTIVVATTADDRSPITIVSSSDGSQPTGGVSVSTVSANSGGHKKGDVIISLPKELGDRVGDYWGMTATCPKKRKRGTSLDCVVQDALSLMHQAGPNGPFRDLVITPNQHLPAIRPGDLLNALNQVIDAGGAMAFLALDNAGVQALAEICFWIAYEKGVEHIPSLVDFVMPEANITVTADTPEETGNKDDCPEPEHEPVCSNCGGNDGKDHCKGIPEADNAWAGCPCVDGGYFPYRPYKDAQAFLDAQDALGKLPTPSPVVVAPVDPPSQPSCVPNPTGSVKDAHEDELNKAANYFCDLAATNTNAIAPINIIDTVMAGTGIIKVFTYTDSMGNQDDVYDFFIKSVPNCTPKEGFNLASPVANYQCADILHSAWKNCGNQGRGGEVTAGCLVYSVKTKY